MIYKGNAIEVAGAQLGDLADCASDRVLVAVGTGCGVVEWPKPLINPLPFFKDSAVSVHLGLGDGPVGQAVEAGRRLCGLTVNGIVHVKWGTDPHHKEYCNYKLQ